MTGTTAWVNRNVPDRLKSISLCQSLKLSSSTVAPDLIEILANRAIQSRVD
jgi:hypothetical protein